METKFRMVVLELEPRNGLSTARIWAQWPRPQLVVQAGLGWKLPESICSTRCECTAAACTPRPTTLVLPEIQTINPKLI